MPVVHALLGLLEPKPRHGYELKRAYDGLFAHARPLRFGQIYATLARLVRDGRAVSLGEEAGQGPDRKRYAITPAGVDELERWLHEPEPPEPYLGGELFAKLALAQASGRPADELLAAQRASHLARMRELVELKRGAEPAEALAADHALFHLEADLRWMELAGARLDHLRRELPA